MRPILFLFCGTIHLPEPNPLAITYTGPGPTSPSSGLRCIECAIYQHTDRPPAADKHRPGWPNEIFQTASALYYRREAFCYIGHLAVSGCEVRDYILCDSRTRSLGTSSSATLASMRTGECGAPMRFYEFDHEDRMAAGQTKSRASGA